MQNIDKYKAGLITFLITGIVTFGMFSFHISQRTEQIAETFYKIEAKTEKEIQEEVKQLEDIKPTTNKAFNEDEDFKNLMKNFKTIAADDFEKTTKQLEESTTEKEVATITNSSINSNQGYALKQKETETYKNVKKLLDKKQNGIAEHSSGGSTLTYSLKDRRLLDYDTPRYLCEKSGKIVVNIKVDNNGNVFEAYINGSSNSSNQCLEDHAIEYAKSVRFNSSNRTNQLGSITFYFKGK
ncbi:hypothetical protein ACFQ1Q_06655 [Winogradskyella litorisediminis]|uniref:TonB family protein n=1 Tax=Winogradskyella litorisediminis TaxID=1156618 RepID=A0ABW3N635_9FLAO